jgi:hypothetical protein
LTIDESKKFFALVMDLNYAIKQDRQTYKNIMKYVDPESTQKAYKDQIIRFYERPDFLTIAARKKKDNVRDKLSNHANSQDDVSSSSSDERLVMGRKTSYYDLGR